MTSGTIGGGQGLRRPDGRRRLRRRASYAFVDANRMAAAGAPTAVT